MFKTILLVLLLTTSISYAGELEGSMIDAINKTRMTKQEQRLTKLFVNRYYYKVKNLPKNQQIIYAINKILKRTEYLKYYHNPSDVVKGKADCQGYSIMFYLLMKKVNIDCKVVYNTEHMWNVLEGNKCDLVALDNMGIELEVSQ